MQPHLRSHAFIIFPVVAALSAHNLKKMWPSLSGRSGLNATLSPAGDNDCSQEKNTGLLNATAAAEVVKGLCGSPCRHHIERLG